MCIPATDMAEKRCPEGAEGAGDVIDRIPLAEPHLGGVYGKQVLQGLHGGGKGAPGIAHSQAARDRRHRGILEMTDHGADHVVVEGGITVQGEDNLARGVLETGVQ